jgi:hypothetical protein
MQQVRTAQKWRELSTALSLTDLMFVFRVPICRPQMMLAVHTEKRSVIPCMSKGPLV